jgi:endonuclease/exonuclease/phosphatase family metal-dependent hydrolase
MLGFTKINLFIPARLIHTSFEEIKDSNVIRVLSWNVSRWDERNKEKRGGESYRALMLDYIESTGADILCFQEFFESHDPKYFAANIPELTKRGYPYHYFFKNSVSYEGKFQYGLCIFSKLPITHAKTFENIKSMHSEGLLYTDIQFNGKTLRIVTLHLESPGLYMQQFANSGIFRAANDMLQKLKYSYQLRNKQAEQAAIIINKSPHPTIVCANLDDVPGSYAYHKIRSLKKDAFLEQGIGWGRTLIYKFPSIRIDFIFSDPSLKILQFKTEQLPYSDHFPLIADMKF